MNARGFTVVETAAVVMITGILLAITLPAAARYRASLKGMQARQQLAQDLRAARQRAVTQRTPVVVRFGDGVVTTNVTTYTVHADLNGDRLVQSGERVVSHTLPTETKIELVNLSPTDSLVFDISGVLFPGTSGGSLIVTSRAARETLLVSSAGMVYQP